MPATSPEAATVVLVDDEPTVLRAFTRALLSFPYVIDACRTARQAIDRIAQGGVHVVVSDISMPQMSGLELLRRVREHDDDLPVVLVTGNPNVDSAASAVEYGAFKYLVKPVYPADLRNTVAQASQLYRLARAKREALELLGIPGGAADLAGLDATFERVLANLWVAFQPIVRTADRAVFGYEALLRSNEPALPGPGHVLDAAERLGRTALLGQTIRARTAESMVTATPESIVFVNLHPRDLLDPDLSDPCSALAPIANRVVLEITERASLGGMESVREKIAELREIGYRIAIDDLGAGYAGLTSFAILEPEFVKLDMTLVRDIDSSPVRQKLVASMTELCKDMGMAIVAEGIERSEERDVLIELGCDLLQGYLLARPGRPFPVPTW